MIVSSVLSDVDVNVSSLQLLLVQFTFTGFAGFISLRIMCHSRSLGLLASFLYALCVTHVHWVWWLHLSTHYVSLTFTGFGGFISLCIMCHSRSLGLVASFLYALCVTFTFTGFGGFISLRIMCHSRSRSLGFLASFLYALCVVNHEDIGDLQ